jgi:hypothetical protein
MTNVVRALIENVDNMQGKMDNVCRELVVYSKDK